MLAAHSIVVHQCHPSWKQNSSSIDRAGVHLAHHLQIVQGVRDAVQSLLLQLRLVLDLRPVRVCAVDVASSVSERA